jgi:two-component system sensor histidine kinase KdpD
LLGVLLLGSQKHRDLTPESLTLFTSIGQQLGLALKNAQLLRSEGEAQALREADRIKSRFLMMVSHDLRSPLTAIRTSVESLLDLSGEQQVEIQGYLLQNIASQSKRLGRMVDQLLDLTRIEAGGLVLDRDWTELGALIVDTVAKFERLNTPCQVKQCLATDLPLVYIDPEWIIQVLWNLLENAYKYAPRDNQISVEAFSNSREIFISVADRGPGIPVEDHDKIFQYFYRLPRDQQLHTPGSGLGLAICLGIINAHGGRIWVEDRPGGGSVFSIAIPYSSCDTGNLTESDAGEPSGLLQSQESLSNNTLIAK